MESLFKALPHILEKARASPLAVLALMIITLALLGAYLFQQASQAISVGIYILLYGAQYA